MKKIKALILDWAGTSVDHGSCAPAGVFIEVFQRRGIDVTAELARRPMGTHKRDHIKTVALFDEVHSQWKKKFGRNFSESDLDAIYAEFIPLQLECLPRYCDVIPGVLEAMKIFRQMGLKIGSTTGYNGEMMNIVAPIAAQQGYIPDAIVHGSDVPVGRPAPWMALENAKRLNIYPLSAFVKIGDTVADIQEGRNAGMWTIGITKTGNEVGLSLKETLDLEKNNPAALNEKILNAENKLKTAGADFIVQNMIEVPAILEKINALLADHSFDERFLTDHKPPKYHARENDESLPKHLAP